MLRAKEVTSFLFLYDELYTYIECRLQGKHVKQLIFQIICPIWPRDFYQERNRKYETRCTVESRDRKRRSDLRARALLILFQCLIN